MWIVLQWIGLRVSSSKVERNFFFSSMATKVVLQSKLVTLALKKKHRSSRVSTASKPWNGGSSDSLFRRIQVVRDPRASILPVLRDWIGQGRDISKDELVWLVRTMRDFRRFNHALEISMWMTDCRYLTISPADAAVRLDLIHRVHGLKGAENYFESISTKLRTHGVYCSLLRGYVRENSVEKAEAIMDELRNRDVPGSSFPYNMLITLYTRNGEFDKIALLMQEMKTRRIPYDKYTLRNRMYAHIAASDVSGMENVLNKMEDDPEFRVDWKVYSLAASGYLKLGFEREASEMLLKLEEEIGKMDPRSGKTGSLFLLTLYSGLGNREELLRVWETYKPKNGEVELDSSYACMIRSLTKLGEIEIAESVFEEWESIAKSRLSEFRVVNSILAAYCKYGLFEKAERVLEKAMEVGIAPYTSSWNILANGYVGDGRIPEGIIALKKGLEVGRKGWLPNLLTLATCLDYLKEKKHVSEIGEIIRLVTNLDVLSVAVCRRLVSACVANGESFSEILCKSSINSSTD